MDTIAGKPLHRKRMGAGIWVKFPVEIDQKLRQMADDDVRPISSTIRMIVMRYLNAETPPKERRAVG